MNKQFIQLKQFTRDSNKGFTLLELLIALIVSSIILGLSLKLIVDQRQFFVQDQTRAQVNQNLRAPMDLVGTDIKQVGERLVGNTQLPVVKIINGGTGPDELVLQRKVIDQVLPVCQSTISGTQSTIDVSVKGASGNCTFSDGNTNGWPDNLEQWRNSRCSKDGNTVCDRTANVTNDGCLEQGGTDRECLWAYIYDPVNKRGEFFLYAFEAPDTSNNIYRIYRAPSAIGSNNTWQYTYTSNADPTKNPVIYILEERDYKLVDNPNNSGVGDNVLQLILNQKNTINLVNQLANFKVSALMLSGTTNNDFNNPAIPASAGNWQQIQAVNLSITSKDPSQGIINVHNLSATSQFYPRNAGSKQ